jgi:hypothetical protein
MRNQALSSVLRKYRQEIHVSDNPAHNASVRDSQVYELQTEQERLWKKHSWPFLRVERYIDLQAGQRFYDTRGAKLYDGTPKSDLGIERLEKVELRWGPGWYELRPDIGPGEYQRVDSELGTRGWPCEAWRVYEDEQFEIWPIPSENADPVSIDGRLRLTGIRDLRPFIADDDRCDLDDNMVIKFAAARYKAGSGGKDAQIVLDEGKGLETDLTGNFVKAKVFSLGGSELTAFRGRRGPQGPLGGGAGVSAPSGSSSSGGGSGSSSAPSVTNVTNIYQVSADSEVIRPEDYTLGADDLNIAQAFTDGMLTGRPVRLDGSYALSGSLSTVAMTTEHLTILGSGLITYTANVGVGMSFHATYPAAVAVSAVTQTTRSFPGTGTTACECTQIAAAGHGCTVGDIIKIVSDDQIVPQAAVNHRQGEFCYVADVDGNDLYVAGYLHDTYTTTVRIVRVRTEAKLAIEGLRFAATPDQMSWSLTMLKVTGFAFPRIRTSCVSGYSQGLYLSSCFMADVDIDGTEMLNRIGSGSSNGYLLLDSTSAYTLAKVKAVDARHAYTTSTPASSTSDEAYLYGRTYGAEVTGTAHGCSSAAFDTHSEAVDVTFRGISTGGARNGEEASGIGAQLRGTGTQLIGGRDFMSTYGANVHVQVEGDCVDNEIIDWNFTGLGDGVRINFPSAAFPAVRPIVRGGKFRSNFTRCAALWLCSGAIIENLYLAPYGSTANMEGIYIGNDVEVLVRNLTVDLSGYSGSTFRVFGIHAAGSTLVVDGARVIGASGKLQAWITGGSNAGTYRRSRLVTDAAPSSGEIINGGSLTTQLLGAMKPEAFAIASLPSAAAEGAGTIVWTTNGYAGAAGMAYSNGTDWKRFDTGATVS